MTFRLFRYHKVPGPHLDSRIFPAGQALGQVQGLQPQERGGALAIVRAGRSFSRGQSPAPGPMFEQVQGPRSNMAANREDGPRRLCSGVPEGTVAWQGRCRGQAPGHSRGSPGQSRGRSFQAPGEARARHGLQVRSPDRVPCNLQAFRFPELEHPAHQVHGQGIPGPADYRSC